MKKTVFITIICVFAFLVLWNIVFGIIYVKQTNKRLDFLFEETKKSSVLNKKFGEIEEVKLANYLFLYSNKKGYECVKFKIKTDKGKYSICNVMEEYLYIVDDEIYEEMYSVSTINVLEGDKFYTELENYFINEIDQSDTIKQSRFAMLTRTAEDNTFKYTNYCEYQKENKCNQKNIEYLDEIFKALGNKYSYEFVEDPQIINA